MRSLLALAAALPLAAQIPPDVDFHLRLANDKTRFQLGETIPLHLSFSSATPEKYELVMWMHDPEDFQVEPAEGASDPLPDPFAGGRGTGPGGTAVLREKPEIIGRDLNEWVRFDSPGQYRITGVSRRVQPRRRPEEPPTRALELRSNTVEVTILPADPVWQAAELVRAIEVLETVLPGPDWKTFEVRRSAARKMRFLNTPGAVRQCVRRFRGVEPLDSEFRFCLLGASPRQLAVETMEQGLRDSSQPVSTGFIDTLAKLRAWLELGAPGPYPKAEPAQTRWRDESKKTVRARDEAAGGRYRPARRGD